MQEIIDDMNYVIDKYKTMVQKMEDFEGYSVEATEEVLNNAVDDGVFADYETVRDRRLAMVEYLNERLKCHRNTETSEPTEEVEETEYQKAEKEFYKLVKYDVKTTECLGTIIDVRKARETISKKYSPSTVLNIGQLMKHFEDILAETDAA